MNKIGNKKVKECLKEKLSPKKLENLENKNNNIK